MNSSSSSGSTASLPLPAAAVSQSCSMSASASVCPASAAASMSQLNTAPRPAGDLVPTCASPLQCHMSGTACTAVSECLQTRLSYPANQPLAHTDRNTPSSLPSNEACATVESRQTQSSFPPSQAFPATCQKSRSSLITGQAFAVANTQNSSPACTSNCSGMETGDSQLPCASVNAAVMSQPAAPGTSQGGTAAECKSAVVNAASSVSRVCICIECYICMLCHSQTFIRYGGY